MKLRQFWWQYAHRPLFTFCLAVIVIAAADVDVAAAQSLFFDAAHHRWLGTGSWWANDFIHGGGRWVIRIAVASALGLWLSTFVRRDLAQWRRPSGYFVVATVLTIGIVGLLKVLTNVDCPWDLTTFGGRYPYVGLLADRPDQLRAAQCFPAAHASSGYALMALFFALRERSTRLARAGLAIGMLTGVIFGIAQQSRGAHFLSHDLWSAALAWLIPLTLYTFAFRARLWRATETTSKVATLATTRADYAASRTASIGSDGVVACGGSGGE